MTSTSTEQSTATVKVGDFFVSSWGYDQTNVDFYKVVGLTPSGKSVKVQAWTQRLAEDRGGPHDSVVPGERPAQVRDESAVTREMDFWERKEATVIKDAPIETKRLAKNWSKPAFTVNSFSVATLWDGQPEYQTGAGFGH